MLLLMFSACKLDHQEPFHLSGGQGSGTFRACTNHRVMKLIRNIKNHLICATIASLFLSLQVPFCLLKGKSWQCWPDREESYKKKKLQTSSSKCFHWKAETLQNQRGEPFKKWLKEKQIQEKEVLPQILAKCSQNTELLKLTLRK